MTGTWTKQLGAAVVGLSIVLAACSGAGGDQDTLASDDSSGDGAGPPATFADGAVAAEMADADEAAGGRGGGTDVAGDPATVDAATVDPATVDPASVNPAGVDAAGVPADRRIIRTAQVVTEVDDIADAAAAVRAAALAADGFLFSQELSERYGTVVIKVPADRFDGALETVVGVGDVRQQSTSAEDVTAAYADLEGRLEALETSINRLLGFLAAAEDIGEVASLEAELTRREAERDSIAGQLQVLEDQTAYSTITMEFGLPDELPDDPDDDRDGFAGGLDDGLELLGDIGTGLAALAGFLLPFLPGLVVLAAAGWWLQRRLRRRFSDRSSSVPAPPVAADSAPVD